MFFNTNIIIIKSILHHDIMSYTGFTTFQDIDSKCSNKQYIINDRNIPKKEHPDNQMVKSIFTISHHFYRHHQFYINNLKCHSSSKSKIILVGFLSPVSATISFISSSMCGLLYSIRLSLVAIFEASFLA